MVNYLGRITELRDHMAALGEKLKDEEFVPIALNGFTPSWKPFVQGISAFDKLPSFENL
jgi:hypothetical protein